MKKPNTIYLLDPKTVKFDTTISTLNRQQTNAEFEATKRSIAKIGQEQPILMDNGLCIDGRHRVKACIELGIQVRAKDIDATLEFADKVRKANLESTSGRVLNKAEEAIKAFQVVQLTGSLKQDVAKDHGIDVRMFSYVATVKAHAPEQFKELWETGKTTIDGKVTSSIEKVARWTNRKREESILEVKSAGVDWNKLINTEAGKDLFWALYNENRRPDAELAEALIEYVNLKYTLKEENE